VFDLKLEGVLVLFNTTLGEVSVIFPFLFNLSLSLSLSCLLFWLILISVTHVYYFCLVIQPWHPNKVKTKRELNEKGRNSLNI